MMKTKIYSPILPSFAIASAVIFVSQACTPSPSRHKVTIGIQVSPAMTLVMVAKDSGLFEKEGIDVELKEFTAGKFALQAFFAGAVDYAISGEVPVALATLQGNKTRVVAQVVESTVNEVRVVARRDGDLTDPTKYFAAKRRKLATSLGGGPEFYTYSFFKHYGIPSTSVEIISQKPEDMPAALATGSVDAVAIFEPYAYFAEKRSTGKEIVFSDPSLYSELYVMNARPEQIEKSPEVVEAVVRALVRAGESVAADPAAAKQVVQKYTKLDKEVIDAIWSSFVFKPALTAKLVEDWNSEAAWAGETGKIPADARVPSFKTIIDPSFLQKVSPATVTYLSAH